MSDRTTPRIRCVEFVDYITDWQEGALSDDLRAEVEEHLAFCTPCVAYVHQLRATVTSLRGALDEAPPAGARETALAAFRDRLRHREDN
jgi:anti-sigma factor RsiW